MFVAIDKMEGTFELIQVDMEMEDLLPYQMKLSNIESLQVDGAFHDEEGLIPEGQGVLRGLIEKCHDMIEVLKSEEASAD